MLGGSSTHQHADDDASPDGVYTVRLVESRVVVEGVLAGDLRSPEHDTAFGSLTPPAHSTRAQRRTRRPLAPVAKDSFKVFVTHFHLASHWDHQNSSPLSVYSGMSAREVQCAVTEFDRCYNQDYSGSVGWFARRESADAGCKAFVSGFKHKSEPERVALVKSARAPPLQSRDYVYACVSPFLTSIHTESGWQKRWAFKIEPFGDARLLTIHVVVRTWVTTRYVYP